MPDRKIAIITDSTCDIPADLIERYAIRTLLQIIVWGGAGD
ncbi:MAG: DegV family protein [Anaerolineales bacterium]|nr:DegV family protein [Anaerolineales bacterium]